MKTEKPKSRGRPASAKDGAPAAFDLIQKFMKHTGHCANSLAVEYHMTPSSVGRALQSRGAASWTPTFDRIYSIAKNNVDGAPLDLQRIADYQGPGNEVVRRLLVDIDELVRTLSQKK